jgi:hypothetical protein
MMISFFWFLQKKKSPRPYMGRLVETLRSQFFACIQKTLRE